MKVSQANPMPRIPWETAVLGCGARVGVASGAQGGSAGAWGTGARDGISALGWQLGQWSFLTCVLQSRLARAGKQNR